MIAEHSVAETLGRLAEKYQEATDLLRKSAEKLRALQRETQAISHDLSSVSSLHEKAENEAARPGFRENVVGILRSNTGLKAGDVVAQAREMGLVVRGKISLERRIAGELSALKRNRIITRDRWGRYRLRENRLS